MFISHDNYYNVYDAIHEPKIVADWDEKTNAKLGLCTGGRVMAKWNWAFEQMVSGKKVCRASNKEHYLYIDDNRLWCGNARYNIAGEMHFCDVKNLLANDWIIYEEPKKWTEEEKIMAKVFYFYDYNWVTRDEESNVAKAWMNKPIRKKLGSKHIWCSEDDAIDVHEILDGDWFPSVLAIDYKPTEFIDIINSKEVMQDEARNIKTND